ncbi:glycosyltransferase family 2 protein [Parabacteroides gordonii]|uniref:glycosyltransferase family 2 protein n=1 Tax=Parabacteroides gordonii TaxID=574930 RepID=UPI000EE0338D|nr:glycosyltransferase family 2 protein [Parabacteroides gordonii]RGP16209.1 glycosyltransferase family 2 protein [Parabacteroides gordonii]
MVSIITINYNGFKETCELIDSLRLYEDYPYEIIVVDNNSPNGDGRRLKETFPELTIICSDKNLGFSGGNNLGYKYARGEYILYMNNDMTISGPFLKTLVKRFQSEERIGLVSPKIKYEHHPDTIQYAGYTPMHPVRISNNLIGVNQKDKGQYDQPSPTAYAHGACMLTSREVIEKAGMMTEIYFLFYEEIDWSIQLKRAGYEIWYEPGACVLHKESMTAKRGTPLRLYFLTRSRLLFTRRNLASFTKITALLYQLLIVIPKNIILYSAHGQKDMLISFIKGSYHGFTNKINK